MFNSFKRDSLKFQHLLGLINIGTPTEDIVEWLDCSEEYVEAIQAEVSTAVLDRVARFDEAAQIARLNLVRMARGVDPVSYIRQDPPYQKGLYPDLDRHILVMPVLNATIDDTGIAMDETEIELDATASWATGKDGYSVADARAGVDFYVFLVVPAEDDPHYLLSDAITAPTGYTLGTDARMLGGFHCARLAQSAASRSLPDLPFPTPEIPGWAGLAVGDILPGSVWDIAPNDIPIISYL